MEFKTKISKKIGVSSLKSVFKKEPQFTNECRICNMKFTDTERTKKHMIKAHSKPKREKQDH
ncbi:MAG: hypothetical protein COV65_01110 [Nitrosopumilales archaeon CG11_big_fil_rev_8_21_14_0_20_33_24]|nr:MAG: hypothetical protein COV65_01110 [Nitrosopumilales archaeon CG11_big_fil_rev_8_21_14_0_20_33_24]PIY88005.1 MAG: hypothetical protein COY74_10540 [Nitrosopumilales archaeon CG_4_10_14_0_8_um_filter_34_8]PJB96501.1 MAG: hypothetical protein CO079_09685 [Nitrosopumilales archaeon CG_4_9_14_0_8_um_filter_34_10]